MQEPRRVEPLVEYDSSFVAHRIVEVASDKKASDVVLLDIRQLTTFADYFVIMSGTSTVQIRALAENIDESMAEAGVRALNHEGSAGDGWVLIDFGQVIVHIFGPEQRSYYGLERLWTGATTVVRIQ